MLTDKASCGLFQTQHEAALHYIPATAHSKRFILWGFNILCLCQKIS